MLLQLLNYYRTKNIAEEKEKKALDSGLTLALIRRPTGWLKKSKLLTQYNSLLF